MNALRLLTALSLACIAQPVQVSAQDYPARSVRIIVPFAVGGPADVFARIVCAPACKFAPCFGVIGAQI